jgi:RINT-1 / TIP-1 family
MQGGGHPPRTTRRIIGPPKKYSPQPSPARVFWADYYPFRFLSFPMFDDKVKYGRSCPQPPKDLRTERSADPRAAKHPPRPSRRLAVAARARRRRNNKNMWQADDVDLGAQVLAAGGAAAWLARSGGRLSSLRDAPALAAAAERQHASLRDAADKAAAQAAAVTAAARTQLADARARRDDAASRAAHAVSEYEDRRARLQRVADAFAEHRAACGEEQAVKKCRVIADAYVNVLSTLQQHHHHDKEKGTGKGRVAGDVGDATSVDTVAENIQVLIREVDAIRRAGPKSLFGESLAVNKRILASIENRCVDSVIKARAAFVNVMDNAFRAFGWPMKVPKPTDHGDMITLVNFYVCQLTTLQKVAQGSSFVAQRTHWHRALSDSWAMAAILRAPLARFKYHFLENYRPHANGHHHCADGDGADDGGSSSVVQKGDLSEAATSVDAAMKASTRRFDRPEWAAEFALERIWEAAPFLKQIVLDGKCTADLKFAEGFCKVFANKMAYDCDLGVRSADDERSADSLVSHTADTAAQFDARLRGGLHSSSNPTYVMGDRLPCALDHLSADERFFTTWALAEQRLAQSDVLNGIDRLLLYPQNKQDDSSSGPTRDVSPSLGTGDSEEAFVDLELECAEIVDRISLASRGCRGLASKALMLRFVKWTELHLLEAVRTRLQEELTACDWEPKTVEAVFKSCRAGWIAHALAAALEDRSCDAFYVALERVSESGASDGRTEVDSSVGHSVVAKPDQSATAAAGSASLDANASSVHRVEIDRLQMLSTKACKAVANAIVDAFVLGVGEEYRGLVRFGELPCPNAAVVLEHDVSESLCACMSVLEASLSSVKTSISNRKTASLVWRPIAEQLDMYFFEDIILQSFTGGQRNAVSAASSANGYMVGPSAAKMSRQIAHDASVLVAVFGRVTGAPDRFLPRCADACALLAMASARVLRPRAPVRQRDEELLAAVLAPAAVGADLSPDELAERKSQAGITRLSAREARECLIVAGMYDALPLE